jgi:hypothetical protein
MSGRSDYEKNTAVEICDRPEGGIASSYPHSIRSIHAVCYYELVVGPEGDRPVKSLNLLFVILISAVSLSGCDESVRMADEPSQVTIPINIVNNRPLVEVQINGMPVTVLFDLGSSTNLYLFPTVLSQLDKVQVGVSDDVKTVHQSAKGTPIYQVDLVRVGDMRFSSVDVTEDFHDSKYQANYEENFDTYGAMGTGLFQEHKLVFDYRRGELTIINSNADLRNRSECEGQEIPFLPDSDMGVLTMARTEIGDIKFVWDTGAVPNIILKSRAEGEDLMVSDKNDVTLHQVAFNGHELGPIEFKVWDFPIEPPFEGFIAHAFFEDHTVCVDFPGNRLFVSK